MATLTFLLASLLAVAHSSIIPGRSPTTGQAYWPNQASPITGQAYWPNQAIPIRSSGYKTSQSDFRFAQPIIHGLIATGNDQSDDGHPVIDTVKEILVGVTDKVADVVTAVIDHRKDVVDDLFANVKDKVSDVVDKTKAIVTVHNAVGDSRKGDVSLNETAQAGSDSDAVDEDSDEQDGGNSTESVRTSRDEGGDATSNVDDSKKILSSQNKNDTKSKDGGNKDGGNKDDSSENVNDKIDIGQAVNGTLDSGERQESGATIIDGGQTLDNDESKSVWSWMKGFTGDDSEDDDTKMRRYLTQMSKVRGYLDTIDSSIAASQAKQTGTCPVYPVHVVNNRITITTQRGCKIIIKLKGVAVDKIQDGREEVKAKRTKRSVMVSYAGDN